MNRRLASAVLSGVLFAGAGVAAPACDGAQDPGTPAKKERKGDRDKRHQEARDQAAAGVTTSAEPAKPDEPRKHSHHRWDNVGMPPLLFELAEKSPEEQERILQANARFRAMPADEQERLRRHLKHISQMTADERRKLRERYEAFHQLPPETREKLRVEIWPAWRALPPERRKAMMAEFRGLRDMTPAGREAHYAQDAFKKQFSPEEQRMLKELDALTLPKQ